MSTETTNKKIKIDNGTTFGRTYTDKAVDELLKGVGGGVAEIVLNDSQMQTLSSTYSITFTDEQANILDNTVAFKWTYNGTEIARGTCNKLFFGGSVSYGLKLFVNGIYHYFYTADGNFDSLTKELTLGSVNIGEAITEENIIIYSDNSTIQFGTKPIRFATINGNGIIQESTGVRKDYSITEDKVIPLFGKHSILVPKNSADTNILPLPADASTSTYVLKAVNGTVQWVKEA